MIRYPVHYELLLLAGALLLLLFSSRSVRAEGNGITIFNVTQQDLNGDGKPDLTIIDCAFATDHDRIYVYDQGGDMRVSNDWREATDFTNDIWMYDIGAKGTTQLIVVYRVEDGHSVAYVYDDQDGDGQVKYTRIGTNVTIQESPYWTARISSNANWFLPDGRANLNLRFELDGLFPTFDRAPIELMRTWMKHDGHSDVEFEEVADNEGIARYAVKRLLVASPADAGFQRTGLYSNEGHYPTRLPDRAFFPLLPIPVDPSRDSQYLNTRYFDFPPDLNIDWAQGKVMAVELPGYPIGNGYHFNDDEYLIKGKVNDVSFESPQAYYDLANDHDAFPDLHIRFFTHPADDLTTFSLEHLTQEPWQSIGYDWNLFNPGTLRWDFKIGVGGNYSINSIVQFPDFAVRAVPFAELPYWVTDREWKLTTFIAREGQGYDSSEGIYEWQADTGDDPEVQPERAVEARDATLKYMQGVAATPPDQFFTTAHPGFRAERHFASAIQPYLYFSPIDHKLHLRGAEYGVWNIDDKNLIRYADLNGDGFLDQWQYWSQNILQRQLFAAKSLLIYAGENQVVLKKASVAPSLFQTLPPRNHGEWANMGQRLKENQPGFGADDLRAMINQFDGTVWRIEGVTLRDYRPVGNGFRFVLELQPGFKVSDSDELGLNHLTAGAYVVSYQNGFKVEPLLPPIVSASLQDKTFTELEPASLHLELRNEGQEDISQATLEVWATSQQKPASLVMTQTVTVLTQSIITPTLNWSPPSAGQWTLTAKIRKPDGQQVTFDFPAITVVATKFADSETMIAVSTFPETFFVVLGGLMTFAAIAALAFASEWRRN